MTQMMEAPEIERYAQVTLRQLNQEAPRSEALLELIVWSQTELEALAAGMWNQVGEQRALQNRCWSAQHAAQLEIVKVALAAGVDAGVIMATTHRESGL